MSKKLSHHQAWTIRLAVAARHPLAATVLAFILTGVLATTFSKWLDYLSQRREAYSAAHARAIQSIKEVTDLLYERRTRGALLASAVRRHARETEVLARKSAYDDTYVRWNATLQSNLFRLREISGSIFYSEYEARIEHKVTPLLTKVDGCLTMAVDVYLQPYENSKAPTVSSPGSDPRTPGSDPRTPGLEAWEAAIQQLDACKIASLHIAVLNCSYVLTDALYVLATTNASPSNIDSELDKNCAMRDVASENPSSPP